MKATLTVDCKLDLNGGSSNKSMANATEENGFEYRVNFTKKRERQSSSTLASINEVKWISEKEFEKIKKK